MHFLFPARPPDPEVLRLFSIQWNVGRPPLTPRHCGPLAARHSCDPTSRLFRVANSPLCSNELHPSKESSCGLKSRRPRAMESVRNARRFLLSSLRSGFSLSLPRFLVNCFLVNFFLGGPLCFMLCCRHFITVAVA